MDNLELTQFGFRWGPMEVTRMADGPFGYVIEVKTPWRAMEIRSSLKGGSLQALWPQEESQATPPTTAPATPTAPTKDSLSDAEPFSEICPACGMSLEDHDKRALIGCLHEMASTTTPTPPLPPPPGDQTAAGPTSVEPSSSSAVSGDCICWMSAPPRPRKWEKEKLHLRAGPHHFEKCPMHADVPS